MELVLVREEPQLLLLFLVQLVYVDGFQIHQELLKQTHRPSRPLTLVAPNLILILLLPLRRIAQLIVCRSPSHPRNVLCRVLL